MGRSKSIVKGFGSVAQLVFSSITLYRARDRYGYAAFGLSVFPYALISFVNLVVIIVGEYSTHFVLRMAISNEAKRCTSSGTISDEIGTLPEESPVDEGGNDDEDSYAYNFFLRVPSVEEEVCNSKRLGCLQESIEIPRTETNRFLFLLILRLLGRDDSP